MSGQLIDSMANSFVGTRSYMSPERLQVSEKHDFTKKKFYFTVLKFHDFSFTQILRESKFVESKSAKSTILTHLRALKFDFYAFCTF